MTENTVFGWLPEDWTPPPEFCISPPRRMKWKSAGVVNMVLAFLIGFLGFGVVSAVFGATDEDHRLKEEAKETNAVVARTWTESGKSMRYMVAYEFVVAGQTVQGEAQIPQKKWRALSRGANLPVKYVPSKPSINRASMAYQRLLPYWLPLACLLIWIGMLSLAVFPIRKERRLLKSGQAAYGVVTFVSKGRRPKYGWITKYEFHLSDGTTIKGSTQRDRTYYAGQPVSIIYDPKHPKRNEIHPLRLGRIVS